MLRSLAMSAMVAEGWWDEGHMLIASVARTWLTAPPADHKERLPWSEEEGRSVVLKFDRVFKDWQPDFPQFTDLISASVWADHIKCQSRSSFCESPYGIQIFNENHFVDIFYNRTMSESERRQHFLSALERKDNASFLLHKIHESLIESSKFTANLLVRLFIHVFGDIHQPLHTMVYRGDCFTSGDRGGNTIFIYKAQDLAADADALMGAAHSSEAYTLHGLWDSGGWHYGRSYPDFTVAESNAMAAELVARHPNQTFHDFHQVIQSSYNLAPLVYHDVIEAACSSLSVDTAQPRKRTYVVTAPYLKMIRQISEERVAAAGFSLAFYLQQFASRLDLNDPNEKLTSEERSSLSGLADHVWQLYSAAVTIALAVAIIWRRRPFDEDTTSPLTNAILGSSKASLKYSQKPIDAVSCGGLSDNLSERLVGPDLEDGDPMAPPRVIVSTSSVQIRSNGNVR